MLLVERKKTKNLSIKIERKSVSEGSHTCYQTARSEVEEEKKAIEKTENEKSFNFQSIIKVVIKRNFSSFKSPCDVRAYEKRKREKGKKKAHTKKRAAEKR